MAETISCRALEVRLGGKPVLGPIDLGFEAGTMSIVVGPNGAGKSTLVKALGGELKPAAGSIAIASTDLRFLSAADLAERRAVLSQVMEVAFPFTVHEVVRLGLERGGRGERATAIGGRVESALARVDLEGFGPRNFQSLSGGEAQRVHLARVLCQIGEPVDTRGSKLLILDEPISSLDIRHQIDVLEIARSFADAGGTVIAVLHDLNLAASFADRMVLMERGLVREVSGPHAMLASPVLDEVFAIGLSRILRGDGRPPLVVADRLR